MSPRQQSRLAIAALLAGATGIGFAPLLVRLADTGPSATAFYRVLFALPLLWCWAVSDHRRNPGSRWPASIRDVALLSACGLLFAADLSIWHWSLRFTTVANSTLFTNVAPLFVTIGAWVFLRESITPGFVAGMVLAIGGGALLAGASADLGGRHLYGDVLAVIAAFFYGGYLLMLRVLRRRFRTAVLMACSGLVSCPAFGVIALVTGDTMMPVSLRGWAAVAALALVSHVGGQTLIAYGFGHLPAGFSSLTLLCQPAVAIVTAWIFLGEPLGWFQWIGALVVLTGIGLASGAIPAPTRGPSRLRE